MTLFRLTMPRKVFTEPLRRLLPSSLQILDIPGGCVVYGSPQSSEGVRFRGFLR
jgi:hypothetical protein